MKNGFKFIKRKAGKLTYRQVDVKKFWKWAENNRKILNFANMEENILGAEPDWVKEKRKADLLDPTKVDFHRKWTQADDNKLISMVKQFKSTYADLAVTFNRTEGAIKRRLYDLGVPWRPVPLDNHIRWTPEEKEKVKELRKKGYSAYTLARIMGRSQLTIANKK